MILEVKANTWINDFKKAELLSDEKITGTERVSIESQIINLIDSNKKTDILEVERLKHLLDEKCFMIKFTVSGYITVFSDPFNNREEARNYFLSLTRRKLT